MRAARLGVVALLIAVSLVSAYALAAGLLGDKGCCKSPPCSECFEERMFCDCELRIILGLERFGLEECEECEVVGCGEGVCKSKFGATH